MAKYGIPYMGSKGGIVESILLNFPKADNFYDLFGGGFSVTHAMLVNCGNRYKAFHYNEIKADVVDLVKRAIAGEFNYERFKPEWVSRKDFFEKKDSDAYIKLCWSFGNGQKTYLFGEDIEPYKRSMHQAVVFGEFDELARLTLGISSWPTKLRGIKDRRLFLRAKIEKYRLNNTLPKPLERFLSESQMKQLEQLERLQQLQQLEQLERLQKLEQLQGLQFHSADYRKIEIEQNSIVYCDIPYKGTADYGEFNHEEFYEWALTRTFPVYISEYEMPEDFRIVYEIDKRSMLSQFKDKTQIKQERLYWNGVNLG
jgi:site-specific DNA-adenine methylase